MNVEVTEGAFMDGMHILTVAELERVVDRATQPLYAEIRALRQQTADPPPPAGDRRAATYRNSSAKRYDRYRALLRWYGEPSREPWTRHLAELDKRFKAHPPEFPREVAS